MNALLRFLGMMLLAVVVLAAVVIYTGAYNISAKQGHSRVIAAVANTLMERSVRAHARDIVSPVGMDFRDPALLEKAAGHFEAMCRTCHGAPGKKPNEWELYPSAPDLADAVRDRPWNDAEVFWIVQNGIKNTAMSAFGGSHSDKEIWGLVALIRQFPSMKPEQYAAMAESAGARDEEHEHEAHPATEQPHEHSAKPHRP